MKENISQIDKNFEIVTKINRDGLSFYDVKDAPFEIYGL